MFVTTYDAKFLSIPFYKTHPYMMPFVGCNYESPEHKKLLLVGESHYLHQNSTIHRDIEGWYAGADGITDDECECCNTRHSSERGYGKFKAPIEAALRNFFPSGFDEIAAYNYFLRPANEGSSFRKICKKKDHEKAVLNLHNVLEILSPDLVAFFGVLAFDSVEKYYLNYFKEELWDYTERKGINYLPFNHPSRSSEWNGPLRRGKMYGQKNSLVFLNFLRENWILEK